MDNKQKDKDWMYYQKENHCLSINLTGHHVDCNTGLQQWLGWLRKPGKGAV